MFDQIRVAHPEDLAAAARLRWRSIVDDQDGTPVSTFDEFADTYLAWASAHAASHTCVVAAAEHVVIGTAWAAFTSRVPSPRAQERVTADVQSVYVLPEFRNQGVGEALVRFVIGLANDVGAEHVTVHSSERAVPLYRRTGFASSSRWLQQVATSTIRD